MADVDPENVKPPKGRLSEQFEAGGLLTPRFAKGQQIEREGLPPGYRMRADSHYVDQLSARASGVPLRFVPLDDIDAPHLDPALDESLQALARSIAEHGVLQPLLVRRDGSRYR